MQVGRVTYLDHVARSIVKDQESLLAFLLCDHEEVREQEEGKALLVDAPSEGQLLAVLLPGELSAVSTPDKPPGGRDQGNGAYVPEKKTCTFKI